jgi:hypothetical protein
MRTAIALVSVIPWLSPLSFASHPATWTTGQSGTVFQTRGVQHKRFPFSIAWAANVRYRERATADPPNTTLQHLPRDGIVIWTMIQPATGWPPAGRRVTALYYSLVHPYRFPCCEATRVPGGEWEFYAYGPQRTYALLIRIYWGSKPTAAMMLDAKRVLRSLRLPRPR